MMRSTADDVTLIDDMDSGTICVALEAIAGHLTEEELFQNALRLQIRAHQQGSNFPTFALFRESRDRAGKLVKLRAMLIKLRDKKTSNTDSAYSWGADWE